MEPINFRFVRWKERLTHILSLERIVDEQLHGRMLHEVVMEAIKWYSILPPLERAWDGGKKDMVDGFLLKHEQRGVEPKQWEYWHVLQDGIYHCTGTWISTGTGGERQPDWNTARRYVQGYQWFGLRALDALLSMDRIGSYQYEHVVDGKQTWIRVKVDDEEDELI